MSSTSPIPRPTKKTQENRPKDIKSMVLSLDSIRSVKDFPKKPNPRAQERFKGSSNCKVPRQVKNVSKTHWDLQASHLAHVSILIHMCK